MDDAVLVHRGRLDRVKRLGQPRGQRPQERLLRLPTRRYRKAGGRADPLDRTRRPIRVGPRLEPGQAVEPPALDVEALAVADTSLRLPLRFGRANLAGIDVKANRASVYTILLVDMSPGAAPPRDARLEVVDPVDRSDPTEPPVGLVVDV